MRSLILSLLALIAISPHFVEAGAQTDSRVRASDLSRVPLTAGHLRITVTRFRDHGIFRFDRYVRIEMQIENTSSEFVTFSPQSLSFVESDNNQVHVLGIRIFHGGQDGEQSIMPAQDRKIAPGARIKVSYVLTDRVTPPARFYYDDKLLATITD